jgi:hypothetical protein
MLLILVIILLVVFGFGGPYYGPRWGYSGYYWGLPSLLLVILLILLLVGAFGGSGPVFWRR